MRIVGIDTGIVGSLDADQAEWFRRVSYATDRPKILITGKPLIVNGEWISEARRKHIAEVVADPAANYLVVIGGDTHNYQRYPVDHGGRTVHYVVSGGGGAYTHATHQIPRVELRRRGRLQVLPAAQRLAGEVLAALRREVRGRARAA